MSRSFDYEDIVYLPHPEPARHPRMSLSDRAAQFSPFAALTGYDDVISEAARETESRIELSDDRKEELDRLLSLICSDRSRNAAFTYFVPDKSKNGGKYVTAYPASVRIDRLHSLLIIPDETEIPIDDIVDIELL